MIDLTVRILVVDDFEPWRRHVCSILEARPELRVVAEGSDGLEAIRKTEELKPDLILLDIGLPILDGLETAHRICRLAPGTKIIFVTQHNEADVIAAALSNGAKGFVWKQDANTDLLPAVEAVLGGVHFISPRIAKSHGTIYVN